MASVYGTLANSGKEVELSPILEVKDYLGNTIEDNRSKPSEQAVPQDVAFILSDILSDNNARSGAFGASSALAIPGSWVAVKTGTSNEKRDNWAIGYTDNFVVTVWVGNNNNDPMNQTLTSGITGATPIWRKITDHLLTLYPSSSPTPPSGIIMASCRGRNEYFVKGTENNACGPIPNEKKDQEKIAESKPQELFSVQAEEPEVLPPQTQKALERIKREIDLKRKDQQNKKNN
jgi:membrane peptidoglycan carboxypeptidase